MLHIVKKVKFQIVLTNCVWLLQHLLVQKQIKTNLYLHTTLNIVVCMYVPCYSNMIIKFWIKEKNCVRQLIKIYQTFNLDLIIKFLFKIKQKIDVILET